jgi:pilus assembly protein CpaE
MARLNGVVLTDDETFRAHITGLFRMGPVPISPIAESAGRDGQRADIVVIDARSDLDRAMARAEPWRASGPAGVFAVASDCAPDLILRAMRAGANEFFAWPPAEATFHEAVDRASTRVAATSSAPASRTIVFIGAKGGAGTTTVAVNCSVEIARLSKRATVIVDLKGGTGEIGLFLGVRSRYSLLDALDNLHRLDSEFIKELTTKHKSGLDILVGSDQWERPSTADVPALEEVFRLLSAQYEYLIVDAGSQINPVTISAMYSADQICVVANPDVPSVRNAQRIIDRLRQLGPCGDRVRLLLNRAAEPFPIPRAQIESAVGHPIDHSFPSDYKTVSAALNSGVPLALTGNSEMATQFDRFTRRVLNPDREAVEPAAAPAPRRVPLGLKSIASIW